MKPVIEDIPQQKREELEKILESNCSSNMKHNARKRLTGICVVCGAIASKLIKYKLEDITQVQRYCQSCFIKSGIGITPAVTKLIDTSGKNVTYAVRKVEKNYTKGAQ